MASHIITLPKIQRAIRMSPEDIVMGCRVLSAPKLTHTAGSRCIHRLWSNILCAPIFRLISRSRDQLYKKKATESAERHQALAGTLQDAKHCSSEGQGARGSNSAPVTKEHQRCDQLHRKKATIAVAFFLWSIGDSKTNHNPLYKPLQECFLLRISACDVARL